MDDLISRQQAIDECNKRGAEHIGYAIAHLPSAQPERKKGKWIDHNGNIVAPFWERYECSECGARSDNTNYCPNCGADMRGEQE